MINIDEIRNNIQVNISAWENIYGTNCYSYALGLDIPEYKLKKYFYQPGVISSMNYKLYNQDYLDYQLLIKNIEEDFKVLNLDFRSTLLFDEINDNEWKIVLCTIGESDSMISDFHFIRCDSNGRWSNKPDYNQDISFLSLKSIKKMEDEGLNGYTYKKCYVVKKKL